jgi:hypothetical protein
MENEMNKNEEIQDLERENDELKVKVKDLEYSSSLQQLKDEVLWNPIDGENNGTK